MKKRKMTEVDGGYLLTTYQSARPGAHKKFEKFIPKKLELSDQPNQGWAFHNRDKRSIPYYHFFKKGDKISLCGQITIISKNIQFINSEERFKNRTCGTCQKICDNYSNIENWTRIKQNDIESVRPRGEW